MGDRLGPLTVTVKDIRKLVDLPCYDTHGDTGNAAWASVAHGAVEKQVTKSLTPALEHTLRTGYSKPESYSSRHEA
ncbi:UNVERIFIED_CONTAM: hypothetical protein K2H54_067052 [Gekko kuhli]